MGRQYNSQFKETEIRFRSFVSYANPLTWEEWVNLPSRDAKVAVLFCQFYDQITLAWYKAKADFISDDEGVSCVLQYLTKNVDFIEKAKDKFNPAYIYRVSYNCMDCLRYVQRDINRYNLETSSVVECDGDELNLYDLTPYTDEDYETREDKAKLWAIIKEMGPEAEKVINFLVNGESLRRVSSRSKEHGVDPLTDVGVTPKRLEEIMAELRDRLSDFREIWF